MDLNDKTWTRLEGGYRIPYDASGPLKRLRDSANLKEIDSALDELWENLHHQGDVGIASYLSIPKIIESLSQRRSFDWKFIGLVVLIENCRINGGNPELPAEYNDYYFGALSAFERYLLENFKSLSDPECLQSSLAFLATVNGLPGLGRVIEYLDDESIREFIGDRL